MAGIVNQYGNEFMPSPNPDGEGKPDLRELGSAGSLVLSGFDLDEANTALQGAKGLDTWKAMGHDPTVAMVLKTYEMPQRACDWYVEPADESPQAVELADFIHYNFWEFGAQSWDEIVRQASTGRNQYGFNVFEQVYRIDDDLYPDKVCLDKLAWRAPQTIYKWNIEEVDLPDGSRVRKLVSITQWAPPSYQFTVIPADKLAVFVRDQNGENFRGQPLTRAMYKPWWIRDRLYSIQSIGLERAYMGIPIGKLPMMYTKGMQDLMKGIVQGLRTHERAGAVMREDMNIEMLHSNLEGTAMQAAIDFHTHQIPLSALAQFTLLGSGATGSFALSHDQSDLFLMMLNGDANYTASVVNLDPVIPRLIDFNFPNVKTSMRPQLKHGDMGQRDLDKLLRGIGTLAQWGVIVPDDPLEDALRKEIGLPERDGTVTPEFLQDLLQSISYESAHDFSAHTKPRPAAPGAQSQGGAPSGDPSSKDANTPQEAAKEAKMSEYRRARAALPWRRPQSRNAGKLSGSDRMQALLSEQILGLLEDGRKECGKVPVKPSIKVAMNRKPYVLKTGTAVQMAEKKAKTRDATRVENVAAKHKSAMVSFLAAQGKSKRTGHVPLPDGVKVAFDEPTNGA